MFEDSDDARTSTRVSWGLQVFHDHPDLFACWVSVDATHVPWALGIFDEDFSRTLNLYGRHGALLSSPVLTLRDLPVDRTAFRETPWPASAGLCLTLEHYAGVNITFHQHPDGSGGVHYTAREGCGGGDPLTLHVAYAVIAEYLACTTVDPTQWHERPGWVRNPRPFNAYEAAHAHYVATGDSDLAWHLAAEERWFASVQAELARRWIAACR